MVGIDNKEWNKEIGNYSLRVSSMILLEILLTIKIIHIVSDQKWGAFFSHRQVEIKSIVKGSKTLGI